MHSPIPVAFVPYLVLIFNGVLFKMLRVISFIIVPPPWKLLISEILSTTELCADVAELGVVYERHGFTGYTLALFAVGVWWCLVFDDAEACPCGPIEEFVLRVPSSTGEKLLKLTGQIVGCIATAGYINLIWCFHLMPEHALLHTSPCQASLQVSIVEGALIEGLITFISRMVALESGSWNIHASAVVNSVTTVLLVLAAFDTTGGFFNPIMASALTLGCHGNTVFQHFMVYWVGALIGGILARFLHMLLRRPTEVRQKIE